ncbi:MAG: flagellar hook-basal body complex protein FliE [Candidatus Lokiarchaeota archaeon]|nr:flagellar hook-basal body complex protein FliE [Candidatus Lokiarchaeota archaeon]
MKVIGFCGLPGSGKSTVLKAIEDLGVIITMGDVIRNEALERNIEPTDENLGRIAQELREKFGSEIIAVKCVELIKNLDREVVFIDGLRSIAEVKIFRKSWIFPIVAVIIDDSIRFERLSKRGRPDDPNTLDDLRERDQREIAFGLNNVIRSANYEINNNVSKNEVQKKTRNLILKIIRSY